MSQCTGESGSRGNLEYTGKERLRIKKLAIDKRLTLEAIADQLPISETKSLFKPGTRTVSTVSNWANDRNTDHIVRLIKIAMLYNLKPQVLTYLQAGEDLVTFRKSRTYKGASLTQRQVGAFLDVSETTVSNWEKDRTETVKSLNVLGHLCTALGVDPSELLRSDLSYQISQKLKDIT